MADVGNKGVLTRNHWAGTAADLDIHLEAYKNQVEGQIAVKSIFASENLSQKVDVEGQSNTYRFDRTGAVSVRSRESGEELSGERLVNDKVTYTVTKSIYARGYNDWLDDYTAPSLKQKIIDSQGTAHAKAYDESHIIQLVKAGAWKAPADLKKGGAFYDGITEVLTGFSAETNLEAKADYIVQAHAQMLQEFVNRDLEDTSGLVILLSPAWYTFLLNHGKLMNASFNPNAESGNSFQRGQVLMLNGVRVRQTPRMNLRVTGAGESPLLGDDFKISATEAKSGLIMFAPEKTLITVEAHDLEANIWEDNDKQQTVFDSWRMHTVGVKRGDTVGVLQAD